MSHLIFLHPDFPDKTFTVCRKGLKWYSKIKSMGILYLANTDEQVLHEAQVLATTVKPFDQLTDFEVKSNHMRPLDKPELFKKMQKFYPDMEKKSVVTLILLRIFD